MPLASCEQAMLSFEHHVHIVNETIWQGAEAETMDERALPRTWLHRIDELAIEHPDMVALVISGGRGESLTWRDLASRSAGIARKQTMAAYKAPRSFEFVTNLDRTEAGKLNRQALARAREQETI
jgi:acyl-CoA synthetase (AMP-forming)/AMP-acid ligase II